MQLTLTEKNLLLRGSILRASEWCVGQIAYTGADTKLSLNSKQTPSKLSSVDRIVNRTLVIAITAMLFVCVLSMIFGIVWENIHDSANYLCLKKDDLATEYVNGVGCSNGSTSTYLTIFTFATLYNNFVCISMYVSLEMVYLCQSYFLSNDLKLYDPTTDSPAECHTSGMCADLGQVQYILSDKTGTLTKNLMIVKQFSIADQIFGEQQFDGNTSTYPAVIHSNDVSSSPLFEKKEMESTWTLPVTSDNKSPVGKLAHDFIRVLVLCNTAMLMPDQFGAVNISTTDELVESLQAESPDEVALILAGARHCGRLLTKRGNRFLESIELSSSTSKQSKAPERVEVLAVNEFESDRKMMSILLRIPDGGNTRIVLLCKGADSSMLKNCSESANPYTTICMDHIEKFAQTGLRTLVLAKKELSEAEAASWLQEYKRASNSLIDRDLMLSQCAHKIEKDMMLLGAVGIEDELQDGAPEAISMMRKAGLNVWMITGDKAATAAAIGKKCCLISEEKMEIVKIINLTDSILKEKVMELAEVVARKKREAGILSFFTKYLVSNA